MRTSRAPSLRRPPAPPAQQAARRANGTTAPAAAISTRSSVAASASRSLKPPASTSQRMRSPPRRASAAANGAWSIGCVDKRRYSDSPSGLWSPPRATRPHRCRPRPCAPADRHSLRPFRPTRARGDRLLALRWITIRPRRDTVGYHPLPRGRRPPVDNHPRRGDRVPTPRVRRAVLRARARVAAPRRPRRSARFISAIPSSMCLPRAWTRQRSVESSIGSYRGSSSRSQTPTLLSNSQGWSIRTHPVRG